MGRSSRAAVAARRSGSEVSTETAASGVSASSPSISARSGSMSVNGGRSPAGEPSAPERRRRRPRFGAGVGSQSRRRRHTSSLTQAICRPAFDTAAISSSASGKSRAAATWS